MKKGSHHSPEARRILALKAYKITKEAWASPNSGLRNRKDMWITRRAKDEVSKLLGKTYEEIYGEEGAKKRMEIARDPRTWRGFNIPIEQRRINGLKGWDIPEERQKRLEAQRRRPSKLEILFTERLDKEFPNEWAFVGDGQVWIAGANPDFINVNIRKLIIETYTPYFKEMSYGQVKIFYRGK